RLSLADSVASAKPSGATRNTPLAVAGPKSGATPRANSRKASGSRVSTGLVLGRGHDGFGGGERALDQRPVGPGLVRAFAQHLAECAAAALAVEQPEQVAGGALERDALPEPALDPRPQRPQQLRARAQLSTEPGDIEAMQQVGVVVGRATEHRAVGMLQ